MKIAILTLPLLTNYGGILQAFALQTVLERMGHEVCVLDDVRYTYEFYLRYPFSCVKRFFKKFVLYKKDINIWKTPYQIERKNTIRFIDKYIHRVAVRNWDNLDTDAYDAIIVGSDQVWRPTYFQSDKRTSIDIAFLSFTGNKDLKRIAYAASFGKDRNEYSKGQQMACMELLKKFDAVSVRESSGVVLCKQIFGVEAQNVLDPTMLLDLEDYLRLFHITNTSKSNGNLLIYILDETEHKKNIIRQIAKNKNLVPFRVNGKVGDSCVPLSERLQPPVESWLRGFYDAQFVITDSFHACVFSILFKKQFLVIGNEKRGLSRINSLLDLFGLEECLLNGEENEHRQVNTINWEKVHAKLKNQKEQSVRFLQQALLS